MNTILITGVTGFLGSHIAEELINHGFKIVALRRSISNSWRCESFKNHIQWINCDNLADAEQDIINSHPKILIHAAWNGVKASERDNWIEQEKNLSFLVSLLEIVKKTKISKIISLGSQAEFGNFEGSVNEDSPCNPNTAYGATKVCVSILLKSFSEQNKIEWYWIRIFSVFGPREEMNWLIPATISNLLEKKRMKLTSCEQSYDYLFAKDFASGILHVVENGNNISGVFIMSSGQSIKLKDILTYLENKLAPKQRLLQIGSIPYRPNQVMHMQGNSKKFFQSFDFHPVYSIYKGLDETLDYYNTKG